MKLSEKKKQMFIQWSKDLRSGKFTQHRGGWRPEMAEPKAHCCLAVLAETQFGIPYHLLGRNQVDSITNKIPFDSIFDQPFFILNDNEKLSSDEIADLLDIAVLEGVTEFTDDQN